jgi:hypothetical protein
LSGRSLRSFPRSPLGSDAFQPEWPRFTALSASHGEGFVRTGA